MNTTLSFTAYVAASGGSKLSLLSTSYPLVFPLSKRDLSSNSFFNVGENGGDDGVTLLTLPPNAKSALVEVYAR